MTLRRAFSRLHMGDLWRTPDLVWVGLIVAAGAAIALTPLGIAAVAVAGALVLLLTALRPHYGLYLLALAVPFGSLREIQVGPMALGGAEAVALLVTATWLARSMALREPIRLRTPLSVPLALFIGAELFFTGALSLQHGAKELLRWLELLAVYLAAVNTLDARRARWLALWLVIGGVLQGLLGAYQFLRQVGPPGFVLLGRFMRAYGTFDQPNPYAGYLGMVAPLALGVALTGWRGWRTVARRAWRAALAWSSAWIAAVVAVAGMVMSWSRGAWIGLVGAVSAIAFGRSWRSAALAVAAAAVLLLVVVGPGASLVPGSVALRLGDASEYFAVFDARRVEVTSDNFALVERMAHWQAAWAMFSDRPWLGAGAGNYEVVYPAYSLPMWKDPLGHAHNIYLNVLAETGLVGLAAYVLFLAAALSLAWRAVRDCRGLDRGLALGVLGALVHLTIHSVFDNLYVHGMNLHVAMLLGIASVLLAGQTRQKPVPEVP